MPPKKYVRFIISHADAHAKVWVKVAHQQSCQPQATKATTATIANAMATAVELVKNAATKMRKLVLLMQQTSVACVS